MKHLKYFAYSRATISGEDEKEEMSGDLNINHFDVD